uniref:Uncharacterized protein n=1 Tax=Knipowitschia caucasica TaxID=637954 RepID=A0AAV2J3A9_KNICA
MEWDYTYNLDLPDAYRNAQLAAMEKGRKGKTSVKSYFPDLDSVDQQQLSDDLQMAVDINQRSICLLRQDLESVLQELEKANSWNSQLIATKNRQEDEIAFLKRQVLRTHMSAILKVKNQENMIQELEQKLRDQTEKFEVQQKQMASTNLELAQSKSSCNDLKQELDSLQQKNNEKDEEIQQLTLQHSIRDNSCDKTTKELKALLDVVEKELQNERAINSDKTMTIIQLRNQNAISLIAQKHLASKNEALERESKKLKAVIAKQKNSLLLQERNLKDNETLNATVTEVLKVKTFLEEENSQHKEFEQSLTPLKEENVCLKSTIVKLEATKKRVENESSRLKTKNAKLEDDLSSLKSINTSLMSTNEVLRKTVSDSDAAKASLHDDFYKVLDLIQQQKDQESKAETQLVLLKSTIKKLKNSKTQLEQQVAEDRTTMTELQAEVERLRQRLEYHGQPTVALSPINNTPRGDSRCVQKEGKVPET